MTKSAIVTLLSSSKQKIIKYNPKLTNINIQIIATIQLNMNNIWTKQLIKLYFLRWHVLEQPSQSINRQYIYLYINTQSSFYKTSSSDESSSLLSAAAGATCFGGNAFAPFCCMFWTHYPQHTTLQQQIKLTPYQKHELSEIHCGNGNSQQCKLTRKPS